MERRIISSLTDKGAIVILLLWSRRTAKSHCDMIEKNNQIPYKLERVISCNCKNVIKKIGASDDLYERGFYCVVFA